MDNNFDCRSIDQGMSCKYLSPWNIANKDEISHICSCTALNAVIFPYFKDFGRFTQRLVSITPIFECPMMQQLRVNGAAPHMMASITKDGLTGWIND